MSPNNHQHADQSRSLAPGPLAFSSAFLSVFPAFHEPLSETDRAIGRQWFSVWTKAMEAAHQQEPGLRRALTEIGSIAVVGTPAVCADRLQSIRLLAANALSEQY